MSLVIGTMPPEHFLELSKEEITLWLNAVGPAPHTLIKRSRLTSMLEQLLSTCGMSAPSVPAVDSTSSSHSNRQHINFTCTKNGISSWKSEGRQKGPGHLRIIGPHAYSRYGG